VPGKIHQGIDRDACCAQAVGAGEVGQVDHEERVGDDGACAAQQFRCGKGGAARGDQVVDEGDVLARRIAVGSISRRSVPYSSS
jgi:hypothetical protein